MLRAQRNWRRAKATEAERPGDDDASDGGDLPRASLISVDSPDAPADLGDGGRGAPEGPRQEAPTSAVRKTATRLEKRRSSAAPGGGRRLDFSGAALKTLPSPERTIR